MADNKYAGTGRIHKNVDKNGVNKNIDIINSIDYNTYINNARDC